MLSKKYILPLILTLSLQISLLTIEGRYEEFRDKFPNIGDQYRAVLLIEKIKKERNSTSPRTIALKTMLEIELDNLEDLIDLQLRHFRNVLMSAKLALKEQEEIPKPRTPCYPSDIDCARAKLDQAKIDVKTREDALNSIKSLRQKYVQFMEKTTLSQNKR